MWRTLRVFRTGSGYRAADTGQRLDDSMDWVLCRGRGGLGSVRHAGEFTRFAFRRSPGIGDDSVDVHDAGGVF